MALSKQARQMAAATIPQDSWTRAGDFNQYLEMAICELSPRTIARQWQIDIEDCTTPESVECNVIDYLQSVDVYIGRVGNKIVFHNF